MTRFVFTEKRNRRTMLAWTAAALSLWLIASAPPVTSEEEATVEPDALSAYSTFADAQPLQTYFDHQVRLIPAGPGIAHSLSEINQPSNAAAISWLVDGGLANGLHGTSTGNKVPTEVSAQQPGGKPEDEFKVAGGPIGNDGLMRAGAGRSYAVASRGNVPRAYGNSYLSNFWILPAAGSPQDPPGTFDPEADFPGGEPGQLDPAPRGQMAIFSVGHMASTTESFRSGPTVVSIGVAEAKDINIGNRTSDNRCTNCIRIDSIRAEAYAEANGMPGGSKAAYRVILGRACRRDFNGITGKERDTCLPLDARNPQGTEGWQSFNDLDQLNAQFEKPIWTTISGGEVDYRVGIRIHAGQSHTSESRSDRTLSPKDSAERNFAYPDARPVDPKDPSKGQIAPDEDNGQVARAVAEGIDIEIWTVTVSDAIDDAESRIAGTPAQATLEQIDEDDSTPGIQISGPGALGDQTGQQTIPTNTVKAVRRVQFTLGVARASATARPSFGASGGGAGSGGTNNGLPVITIPEINIPEIRIPDLSQFNGSGGPAQTYVVNRGLVGPFQVRVNWASFRIKPWPAGDIAQIGLVGGIIGGIFWLLRRRLRPE